MRLDPAKASLGIWCETLGQKQACGETKGHSQGPYVLSLKRSIKMKVQGVPPYPSKNFLENVSVNLCRNRTAISFPQAAFERSGTVGTYMSLPSLKIGLQVSPSLSSVFRKRIPRQLVASIPENLLWTPVGTSREATELWGAQNTLQAPLEFVAGTQ